jgi:hypothetical protein
MLVKRYQRVSSTNVIYIRHSRAAPLLSFSASLDAHLSTMAAFLPYLYTVSLAAAGLVDNIPADVDLVGRMKLLVEHEAAWKDSPWFPIEVHDSTLSLAVSCSFILQMTQSALAETLFSTLPSIHLGVPGFSAQMDPDIFMCEFSVDTSQGLLIYAQ